MTTTQLIIVALIVVALIGVLAARGGGPRVTPIDRTVRKEKDSGDA